MKKSMPSGKRVLLVTCGLCGDLVGLIPVIGDVSNWLIYGSLFAYFVVAYHAKPIGGKSNQDRFKRLVNLVGGEGLVEAFLFFWPGTTIMVWQTTRDIKDETKQDVGIFDSLEVVNKQRNERKYRSKVTEKVGGVS